MTLKEKFLFISLKEDNHGLVNHKVRYTIYPSNLYPEEVDGEFDKFVKKGLKGEVSRFYEVADIEFINNNLLRKVVDHPRGVHAQNFVKKYINNITVAKKTYLIFSSESDEEYNDNIFNYIGNIVGFKNCLYGTRDNRNYILTEGIFPIYDVFNEFDDLIIIHDYLSLYDVKKSL